MSKKYLSLEEAAAVLRITPAELNRMREQNVIRAFADRGTWKFKEDDVTDLARSREADSGAEVPLLPDAPKSDDSGADLLFSDDDLLGQQPTIVGKSAEDESSDSDVRLIFDDSLAGAKKGAPDSDSDVKLAGGKPAAGDGSDSDVKLVSGEDIPVSTGSDSDVRLVSSDSSDELAVPKSGRKAGDYAVAPQDDSTIELEAGTGGKSVLDDDSGTLLAGDSGISLERADDSGISLAEESSIVLEGDSGISLAEAADSGISLAGDSDSGIALAKEQPTARKPAPKKPKKPSDSDDLSGTVPLLDASLDQTDLVDKTHAELPEMEDSSGDVKVGGSSGTSVEILDEDEGYGVPGAGAETEVFEGAEVEPEVLGEDDEVGEIVAEERDFESDVESGESVGEMPVGPRMAAAVEQEWGTGVLVGLSLSTLLLIAVGTLMLDMVRNLWYTDVTGRNPVASMLLDIFK